MKSAGSPATAGSSNADASPGQSLPPAPPVGAPRSVPCPRSVPGTLGSATHASEVPGTLGSATHVCQEWKLSPRRLASRTIRRQAQRTGAGCPGRCQAPTEVRQEAPRKATSRTLRPRTDPGSRRRCQTPATATPTPHASRPSRLTLSCLATPGLAGRTPGLAGTVRSRWLIGNCRCCGEGLYQAVWSPRPGSRPVGLGGGRTAPCAGPQPRRR